MVKDIAVKFQLERSTKGTHVFQEQSNDAGVEKVVGALYIQKAVMPAAAPEIEVKISFNAE